MSHSQDIDVYNSVEPIQNTFAGDSIAWDLRVPSVIPKKPSMPVVRKKEGAKVTTREKKINNTYNQIIVLLCILALFSTYSLVTGKVVDRISAGVLLILSISGCIAFSDDKLHWRKHSAK